MGYVATKCNAVYCYIVNNLSIVIINAFVS